MQLNMPAAGEFMGQCIKRLAEKRPELRNKSGLAFWPIPVYFPLMLAHTLYRLQYQITCFRLEGAHEIADFFEEIRVDFMRIIGVGDLGEKHTALYLDDHPAIADLGRDHVALLPFNQFCATVLEVANPVVLLGILLRNEAGSLAEAEALTAHNLIDPEGLFARTHLLEEAEHGRIAADMTARLLNRMDLKIRFVQGMITHDELYATCLAV